MDVQEIVGRCPVEARDMPLFPSVQLQSVAHSVPYSDCTAGLLPGEELLDRAADHSSPSGAEGKKV